MPDGKLRVPRDVVHPFCMYETHVLSLANTQTHKFIHAQTLNGCEFSPQYVDLNDWQLFPQSLILAGQDPEETQYAKKDPELTVFRADPGHTLQRPEAQQQPSRPTWSGELCWDHVLTSP